MLIVVWNLGVYVALDLKLCCFGCVTFDWLIEALCVSFIVYIFMFVCVC